jgi:quercetin dioxygenase-like cupin family protein
MMPSVSPNVQEPPPDPLLTAKTTESRPRFPWPQPSDPQLHVEHHLAEGDPGQEILHLARALRCDLIVMGTHGRTGLGRFLTGSVAEEVLRKAACPVLVVKTPMSPTPAAGTEATANLGDIVDVRPLGPALVAAQTRRLLRTNSVEVVRLVVRAGQEIPQHQHPGEVIVQCLEGRVGVTALGNNQKLYAGELLHLPAGEPFAIHGIEDASLLLTILASRH